MCIAILKTKNGKIDNETLEICFENNKDGGGIAYAHNGKLCIEKGFFNSKNFIKRIRTIEKKYNPNMLIHCRIATSGRIDKNNTHPHKINNDLCLIHNGILDVFVPKKSKKSDTVIFIEKYLNELRPDDLHNKTIKNLITKLIEVNNKLIFLDNKGRYTICNEKSGKWLKGCWYSNNSFKSIPVLDYCELYGYEEMLDEPILYNDKITVNKIKKVILNLSDRDFQRIKTNPVINLNNFKIISEGEYFNSCSVNGLEYLDDFDLDLYEFYMKQFEKSFYRKEVI